MSLKVHKCQLVIFLGIGLGFSFTPRSYYGYSEFSARCDRVVDGDTVVIRGEKIRLMFIDAPESKQFSFDGIRIGRQSTSHLKNLIKGKVVKVKYFKRDIYGRLLAELYLGKNNINLQMIKDGMAISFSKQKRHKWQRFEYLARLRRVGIFATLGFLKPKEYRKRQKKSASKMPALSMFKN